MPTYEYACAACGKEFEVFQSMKDAPLTQCPCGSQGTVRRKIGGGAGLIFKGSGFYETDYKRKSSGSSESKSAVKSESSGASASTPAASTTSSSSTSSSPKPAS